jgi:hypothetical protein
MSPISAIADQRSHPRWRFSGTCATLQSGGSRFPDHRRSRDGCPAWRTGRDAPGSAAEALNAPVWEGLNGGVGEADASCEVADDAEGHGTQVASSHDDRFKREVVSTERTVAMVTGGDRNGNRVCEASSVVQMEDQIARQNGVSITAKDRTGRRPPLASQTRHMSQTDCLFPSPPIRKAVYPAAGRSRVCRWARRLSTRPLDQDEDRPSAPFDSCRTGPATVATRFWASGL